MPKILPLVTFPDPLLKQISTEVAVVDDKLRLFMDDMLATMYHCNGVGLSAVQVGVLQRVIVMDTEYENGRYEPGNHHDCDDPNHHHHHHFFNTAPIFMVNPKIVERSAEISVFKEGCLSFPELRADVTRPKKVTVEFLDYHGITQKLNLDGLAATCVQHEIDHLDGITFVDHLSKLKREMLLKKLSKKNKQ